MSELPDPVFQPTTFGKYFLTRRIAVGGMAEVFAAKLYGADGFEKDLVIKQILPQHARDPEFVQSFVAEAKIAVSLNHANIVAIYELGRVDGTYFIAMEYVDGMDLYAFVDGCRRNNIRIEPGHALCAVEEVAKGLDYAHRGLGPDGQPLDLVHRDLNPRNVLASKQGEVKILDFGIAKVRSTIAAMPKTRAGVVKGTTGYMSPEQAMGLEVDARTDIYQAGLLLYEMLTGQALFWRPDDESTRALMRRHEVKAVSTLVPGLPSDFDQLLFDALARNPDDRIPDASTLVRRLAQLRFQLYPDASAAGLGRQVTQLAQLEARTNEPFEPDIPATEELSEVISRAIEQSIGTANVETIARSAIAPRDRPTTGSEPISLSSNPPPSMSLRPEDISATMSLRPDDVAGTPMNLRSDEVPTAVASAPPRHPTDPSMAAVTPTNRRVVLTATGDLVPDAAREDVNPFDLAVERASTDRRPIMLWAALGIAVLSIFILASWLMASSPQPAPIDQESSTIPEAAIEPPPVLDEPTADPAVVVRTAQPDSAPTRAQPNTKATGFATVAFGTRSCSSRVSLDGKIIARSTPSFDHRVPAGPHIVVLEGIDCPPIERPGSLQQVIPTVRREIDVEPGKTIKVIADFDEQKIIVRTK
ncbi:MAG: protein kinase [Myxococcota bacterium]